MTIKLSLGLLLAITLMLSGALMFARGPSDGSAPKSGGVLPTLSEAGAHRVHSVAYVEGRMQAFIREHQCKAFNPADPLWTCEQVTHVFAIPYGRHSWRWNGDYYFRTVGGSTTICHTTGIYADHSTYYPNGAPLLKADTVYLPTKSGPHC